MSKVFQVPIQVIPLPLSTYSMQALKKADSYDWILFSSTNAVELFVRKFLNRKICLPYRPQIGAVGPSTAQVLKKVGFKVHIIPKKHTVEHLVRSLPSISDKRILFPRSILAAHDAVRTLRARGARVRTISLYTTKVLPISHKEITALTLGKYSVLAFRSPSAIEGFLKQLTRAQRTQVYEIPAQCIGPTTASGARNAGFRKVTDMSV